MVSEHGDQGCCCWKKKSENRLDEIESRMASLRSELNQMGTRIERPNCLDVDRLNNIMDRLPKVEESLLSLVRHLEARVLKSRSSVPGPVNRPRRKYIQSSQHLEVIRARWERKKKPHR